MCLSSWENSLALLFCFFYLWPPLSTVFPDLTNIGAGSRELGINCMEASVNPSVALVGISTKVKMNACSSSSSCCRLANGFTVKVKKKKRNEKPNQEVAKNHYFISKKSLMTYNAKPK